MSERLPSEDFPLPKDRAILTEEMVAKIGTFKRRLETRARNKTDFPQPVLVIAEDGREIFAQMTNIYSDTASQADGTFYFDRPVREPSGQRSRDFLWGHEIESVTILSDKTKIPDITNNS